MKWKPKKDGPPKSEPYTALGDKLDALGYAKFLLPKQPEPKPGMWWDEPPHIKPAVWFANPWKGQIAFHSSWTTMFAPCEATFGPDSCPLDTGALPICLILNETAFAHTEQAGRDFDMAMACLIANRT